MTCSDLGFLQDGGRMDWRGEIVEVGKSLNVLSRNSKSLT